jgi:hypothetical protein
MSDIKFGDRINLIGDPDKESFVVLISEPDTCGDVIIKDDMGEYLMVQLNDLELVTKSFKGRFWLSTGGSIYFAVENYSEAFNAGFTQCQGMINIPETMPTFGKWLSELIEVEYK